MRSKEFICCTGDFCIPRKIKEGVGVWGVGVEKIYIRFVFLDPACQQTGGRCEATLNYTGGVWGGGGGEKLHTGTDLITRQPPCCWEIERAALSHLNFPPSPTAIDKRRPVGSRRGAHLGWMRSSLSAEGV